MDGSHSLLIRTAVWRSDAARGPSTPSFDHLVGGEEQTGRNVKAERFGGLQIKNEFEFRGLHDWKVDRFHPAEDFAGIDADLTKAVGNICAVAHQSAGLDKIATRVSCGDPVARGQDGELHAPTGKEPVPRDKQCFVARARNA